MSFAHVVAVLVARNREFLRDRSSLAWNIVFPVLMVIGFAILFADESVDLYKVGVYSSEPAPETGFFAIDYIQFVSMDDLDAAITKVQRHQLDLLFDLDEQRYWVNETSPKGYILDHVLRGTEQATFHHEVVSGDNIRYVDWVVPGVLATNMMFSALFGVGYVIVRYRKNGVLRRLKATPLKPLEFLSAQVLSRLLLIVTITTLVYIGTDYFIDFSMYGSYFNLLLVSALGAASLISLGLLISTRTASQELAGGLLNVTSWPMMLLSGAWFSIEGAPQWVHAVAQLFPLTHLIDAARAIMIDGASLVDVAPHAVVLAVMTLVFLVLGAWLFRWE